MAISEMTVSDLYEVYLEEIGENKNSAGKFGRKNYFIYFCRQIKKYVNKRGKAISDQAVETGALFVVIQQCFD